MNRLDKEMTMLWWRTYNAVYILYGKPNIFHVFQDVIYDNDLKLVTIRSIILKLRKQVAMDILKSLTVLITMV